MVKPAAYRRAVGFVQAEMKLSTRRSCKALGFARSSMTYEPRRAQPPGLVERMKALATQRPRFGYRRLHTLLAREGFKVNHKRVYRLYRLEGLSVRKKARRKLAGHVERTVLPPPTQPNERWSMDFMRDRFGESRKFRTFNLVDEFSRECPAIEVDTSIRTARVIRVLDTVVDERGLPDEILIDNGPEFTSQALEDWAHHRGVKLTFIRPGKPNDNPYIESFNGKFRDECLNEHWFTTLDDARATIEAWRRDYNQVRPHSSLNNMTPEEFARAAEGRQAATTPPTDLQPLCLHGTGLSQTSVQ